MNGRIFIMSVFMVVVLFAGLFGSYYYLITNKVNFIKKYTENKVNCSIGLTTAVCHNEIFKFSYPQALSSTKLLWNYSKDEIKHIQVESHFYKETSTVGTDSTVFNKDLIIVTKDGKFLPLATKISSSYALSGWQKALIEAGFIVKF